MMTNEEAKIEAKQIISKLPVYQIKYLKDLKDKWFTKGLRTEYEKMTQIELDYLHIYNHILDFLANDDTNVFCELCSQLLDAFDEV